MLIKLTVAKATVTAGLVAAGATALAFPDFRFIEHILLAVNLIWVWDT